MITNRILRGNTLDMLITWEYPSNSDITLDTVDFYVEYWTSTRNKFTVQKSNLIRVEVPTERGVEVNWHLFIDTNETGNGNLVVRLNASVPDDNAPNGFKVSYSEYNTGVQVYG